MRDPRTSAGREADVVQRLARYLSIVGHPFIVIPASVGGVSVLRGGDTRAAWVVALLFLGASFAVVVGVRLGKLDDFDISEREKRPGFYVIMTTATVALSIALRDAPAAFGAAATAGGALAACGLLNRWTKASLHTAFALYAAGSWGAWSASAGLVALPVAVSIAWSRVHLGRHSSGEVLAGAAVGLVAAACLLWLGSSCS